MSHPNDDLSALLDGALPPERASELRRHLEGCAACRAERDRLAGAIAAFAAVPPPPAPSPMFSARLAARLAELASEDERRPSGILARLSGRWRIAVPAAALAASAAAALLFVRAHRAPADAALAAELDLLLDYEVVSGVGDVESAEDAAVVAHLDELGPAAEGRP